MSRPPLRRMVAIAAANAAGTVVLLLLCEGLARWLAGGAPQPLFYRPEVHVAGRPFVVEHAERGFALRAGFESDAIRVNAAGLRGGELPDDLGERFLVLAVGDSTVFGWGVRDAESWPARLQGMLEAAGVQGRPYVVNAGVPSYTSVQTLAYLRELLPRYEPDLVLVGVLWNDLWFSSLDPWYPEALVLRRPYAWRQTLHRHSALFRWLTARGTRSDREDVVNERAIEHFADNLEAIVDLCARLGSAVAFVAPTYDESHVRADGGVALGPVRFSKPFVLELGRRFTAAMVEVATRRGVPLIDHRVSIAHPRQPRLFLDAIHPNARGQRLMAQDVGRFLLRHGLVRARSPNREFEPAS